MSETDREELEERALAMKRALDQRGERDLQQYVVNTSPQFRRPTHLKPFCDLLDRAMDESVYATVEVPPRHFKTETALHGIIRMLKHRPERTNAYATYNQDLADRKSRRARDLAFQAEVSLYEQKQRGGNRNAPAQTVSYWQTVDRGGLLAVGIGAGFTGEGVTGICLVDDPFKDRAEAESAARREYVWDWFKTVPLTRRQPGSSLVVMHTRWHPDDLIGRIKKDAGFKHWHHIHLPALAEPGDILGRAEGEALCPWLYDREWLLAQRQMMGGEHSYDWASLYQQQPRPRGGQLFGTPSYFLKLPDTALTLGYGLDLAYTAKKQSNWSVIVLMARTQNPYTFLDEYYVLHVDRVQMKAPEYGQLLKSRLAKTSAPTYWRAGGTEKGVVDLLGAHVLGVPINVLALKGDKFTHAQGFAAAWNTGRVHLPLKSITGGPQPAWVAPFVKELQAFTGNNDPEDDQVDGAVNVFDGLSAGRQLNVDPSRDKYLPGLRM